MIGRRQRWTFGTIGLVIVLGSGTAARREPSEGPEQFSGKDWKAFGSREQEAYLAGFIAGAAVARSDSGAMGVDTMPSRKIDAMRATKQLPFPYSVSVYASQLDDYYWWEDHLSVPIVDALARTSLQLRTR